MEQKTFGNNVLFRAFLLVLVAVVALSAISCGAKGTEGEKTFTLKVVTLDGTVAEELEITTEREMVGEALLDEGLIEGDQGAYGLYIKKVCGLVADYDVDGTYWSFYIGGEYAMTGVDTTPIVDGETYTLQIAK